MEPPICQQYVYQACEVLPTASRSDGHLDQRGLASCVVAQNSECCRNFRCKKLSPRFAEHGTDFTWKSYWESMPSSRLPYLGCVKVEFAHNLDGLESLQQTRATLGAPRWFNPSSEPHSARQDGAATVQHSVLLGCQKRGFWGSILEVY